MTFELINFNEINYSAICNNNMNWDYLLANEWGDVALQAQKLFEKKTERKVEIFESDDNTSLFAEEGSQNGDIKDIKEYLTKETQSSGDQSQNGDYAKMKKRLDTRVVFEELENFVKKEIAQEGIENVLNFCLMNNDEEESNKIIMRKHNNKNKLQVKRLKEALRLFPKKFPLKEREKLAQEIGLSEEQIYRWYYEHNPAIGKKRKLNKD